MRYSVFHTQFYRDFHKVHRSLDISCADVHILGIAKCLVWRNFDGKRRGVSKCFRIGRCFGLVRAEGFHCIENFL